ncbi:MULTISPECIES: glycosyltransferase family 2 protein [Vibrio]|uniref:glycosyltransferase family 2 protein n=1 Tax=Vibrio TaxID=662 RepID=UPI00111C3CFA|nr:MULTISPECIES: glycosyltransferase family 2 protein [Vibrio]TXX92818.1 glycosyltransferase family 2 protein [Vibrio cholerae]
MRVIVINNDDEPLCKNYLSNFYSKELHIVNNERNLGYAGGNNRGYSYLVKNKLQGDILVVNPDIKLTQNAMNEIISARELDNFGAAMISAHNENGQKLYDYIELRGFTQKWVCSEKEKTYYTTSYVAGSFFLVARSVIDEIGFFDEKYFLYWEEVDLSIRIRNIGKSLYSLPSISVQRHSNSIDRIIRSQYYLVRNSFILVEKFHEHFGQVAHKFYLIKQFIVCCRLAVKVRKMLPINVYFDGFKDGKKIKRKK